MDEHSLLRDKKANIHPYGQNLLLKKKYLQQYTNGITKGRKRKY